MQLFLAVSRCRTVGLLPLLSAARSTTATTLLCGLQLDRRYEEPLVGPPYHSPGDNGGETSDARSSYFQTFQCALSWTTLHSWPPSLHTRRDYNIYERIREVRLTDCWGRGAGSGERHRRGYLRTTTRDVSSEFCATRRVGAQSRRESTKQLPDDSTDVQRRNPGTKIPTVNTGVLPRAYHKGYCLILNNRISIKRERDPTHVRLLRLCVSEQWSFAADGRPSSTPF